MSVKTFGDICCGGGGASLGMLQAGLAHRWAIEKEPEIAEVYKANVGNVICTAVEKINPRRLEKVDVLWCSFPCQAFSVARSKKLTPRTDADLSAEVLVELEFLKVLQPQYVFIENVPQYAKSQAFKRIVNHLFELGYWVDFQIINAADLGVPQTRRRLILLAGKDDFIPLLPLKQKRVGWYEAIADLIPMLPETKFAPWQNRRIPNLEVTTLVQRVGTRGQPTLRSFDQPAWTVRALGHDRHWRQMDAFIAAPLHKKSTDSSIEQGRVVMVTPRALARFQSFLDSYQLPESRTLASKIIGNSVPPLMAQKLLGSIKQAV